jgi:leucyl-tRNA synthetase
MASSAKQSKVNWDPVDAGARQREADASTAGWRSGAEVERRELTRWFFRISRYSEELRTALDKLTAGRKSPADAEELIGRSEGLLVRFALDPKTTPNGESEPRFSPRDPTPCSAPSSAIAPDHPLATAAAGQSGFGLHRRVQEDRHRAGRDRHRGSSASTPASGQCIRSIRRGSFRSTSPISS